MEAGAVSSPNCCKQPKLQQAAQIVASSPNCCKQPKLLQAAIVE